MPTMTYLAYRHRVEFGREEYIEIADHALLRGSSNLQDDVLLSGSLADNIAFFDPDPDQERIQACAQQAAASSWSACSIASFAAPIAAFTLTRQRRRRRRPHAPAPHGATGDPR